MNSYRRPLRSERWQSMWHTCCERNALKCKRRFEKTTLLALKSVLFAYGAINRMCFDRNRRITVK